MWKSIWRNKNALKLSPWFSQYFLLLWMHFGSTIVIENNSPHWKIKSFYMYIKDWMCWSINVLVYRRQTSYSTGEAESAIYVYMFVMGHLLTQKLTKYNLFRLLVHSSPKTIYICMYIKWKKDKTCCLKTAVILIIH